MTCCDSHQTRKISAAHGRTLLGRDQTTVKKTSCSTALCCVVQCVTDVTANISISLFLFQCEKSIISCFFKLLNQKAQVPKIGKTDDKYVYMQQQLLLIPF